MNTLIALTLLSGLFIGCSSKSSTSNRTTAATSCEGCLAGGGTWQPEAGQCTEDCNIMDISCYQDECPGECSAGSCGDCFSKTSCEAASCTWNIEAEAAWCN